MKCTNPIVLGALLFAVCLADPRCVLGATDVGIDANPPLPSGPVDDALFLSASESAPSPGDSSDRPQTPLMNALDQIGVGKWMARNQVNAFGWVEASYNYNFANPQPRLNVGHLFDVQDSDAVVNQLQVNVERTVELSRPFDLGGRIDLLYGSDARFIHSSKFFDARGFPDPQYQFDIPQLYADMALPVGNGLRLRIGKFEFFKFTDPNSSPLFSHTIFYTVGGGSNQSRLISSQVGASLPFTLTGINGYYEFGKQMSLEAGIGRGYDQTLTDNNGAIDGFGRLNYAISDRTKASFALICGPEITGDNSHYRTSGDLGIVHAVSDDLLILADGAYGVQARGKTLFDPDATPPTLVPLGDAHWYGVNETAVYRINRNVSAAARFEWYRDEQGYTTALGSGVNLYEATLGLTIAPFPDSAAGRGLKIRPEIRYDFSDRHFFLNTSPGTHQWIAAVDAIYNF